MSRSLVATAALAGLLVVAAGCGSPAKTFTVVSYPSGAAIYVDEVQAGQTDRERLQVDFRGKPYRTLRVEKPGYQTEGLIISPQTPPRIDLFLKKAPDPDGILRKLAELEAKLDQAMSLLDNN